MSSDSVGGDVVSREKQFERLDEGEAFLELWGPRDRHPPAKPVSSPNISTNAFNILLPGHCLFLSCYHTPSIVQHLFCLAELLDQGS